MGQSVEYIGEHSEDAVTFEIGSTLTRDSCEVSWGFDNVEIFVR